MLVIVTFSSYTGNPVVQYFHDGYVVKQMKFSLLNTIMLQLAGDFISVWFMKFVIFLSQGWFDPNWALRQISVHPVREKNRKRRHHNSTIIVFTHFLVTSTTPINRLLAIYLVPLAPLVSAPVFIFRWTFSCEKHSTMAFYQGNAITCCWQSQKMPNNPCQGTPFYKKRKTWSSMGTSERGGITESQLLCKNHQEWL